MNARSPTAFMLSMTLHALFAAAMFFAAYAMRDEVTKESKVFELVQGEGDNYAATDAPALGTPDGNPEIKMPDLPPSQVQPAPLPPAPEPVVQAQPEPSPVQPAPTPPPEKPAPTPKPPPTPKKPEPSPVVKTETKKPDATVPDPLKTFKRTQSKIAYQQKKQKEKEARAAKAAAAAAALKAKQEEYARQKAAAAAGSGVKKIDAKGIAAGVVGGSTKNDKGGAGGTALSREEQDLLGSYIALLKLRISEAHEKPTGLSENLVATVEIYVAADGSIPKCKIYKSSGNSEFDASALAAVRNSRNIGPRPDGKGSSFTFNIKMQDED